MSGITTHVLDTAAGRPAAGVKVRLESEGPGGEWRLMGEGVTDADGRLRTLLPEGAAVREGVYRLRFETGAYFSAKGQSCFYPRAEVTFRVGASPEHYHVPLLLSPFGFSTYRGS